MALATALALAFACGHEIDLSATPTPDAADDTTAADAASGSDAPSSLNPEGAAPDASFEVVEGQPNVTAIGLDSKNVYWATNVPDGGIFKCPKDGACSGSPLLLGARDRPGSIATFNDRVYWTEKNSSSIQSCGIDTCNISQPLNAGRSKGGPIAIDEAGVYMIDGDDAGLGVSRCQYSTQCTSTATSNGGPPTQIAAGGGQVFFTAWEHGELRRLYPDSLAIEDVITDRFRGTTYLAVMRNRQWIFFVNELSNEIRRADGTKGSNMVSSEVYYNQSEPRLIAVDDNYVYWSSRTDDKLRSCPIAKCEQPRTLAQGVKIGAIAVDSSGVWFSNLDDESIRHIGP